MLYSIYYSATILFIILEECRTHLQQAEEGYFEHGRFACCSGLYMITIGIVLIIHGLIPGLFTDYGSKSILSFAEKIRKRRKLTE